MLLYQESMSQTRIFRVFERKVARLSPRFFFFFFKNGILKTYKKIEKIHIDCEKSINSFELKKGEVIWLFIEKISKKKIIAS